MASQLNKGFTFTDGQSGYLSANLHALINSGTILPGAITEQTSAVPTTDSNFLYEHNGLKRCTLQQILNTIPANSPSNIAALRQLGVGSNQAAPGNDSRFPAVIRGIRLANGPAADTVAAPKDTLFTPVTLTHNQDIDSDDANVFTRVLSGNETFNLLNRRPGRTITIIIQLNGHTATFAPTPALATVGTGTTFWYITLTYTSLGSIGTGHLI